MDGTAAAAAAAVAMVFKKNLNAAKPPEQSKGLRGNILYRRYQLATSTAIYASPCRHHLSSCCFSHSAHWLPTRKKLLYTVANPARGLLNREKKKKKKSGSTPPPPRALLVRRQKKIKIKKSRDASTFIYRRYASRRYAGCNKASRGSPRQTGVQPPKLFTEKMIKFPCQNWSKFCC